VYTGGVQTAEELDVGKYAHEATARLVATVGAAGDDWREIIDRGLAAAYARSDAEGLMQMVQLVSHLLESQGRFEDAIGELDHALVYCRTEPDAGIILHGIKASALMAVSRPAEAEEALTRGRALLPAATAASRLRFQIFECVVGWQQFKPQSEPAVAELLQACTREGLLRDRLFLLTWYVPFLAMSGDRHRAHPYIREIRLSAMATESRWRLSDAAAFETWDQFVGEPGRRGASSSLERANPMSVWRGRAVQLRDAILRRDQTQVAECLQSLRSARRTLATASIGLLEQFESAADRAQRYTDNDDSADPPASVNLNTLGAFLAQAESIAIAGTQRSAADWFEQMAGILPASAESSLEWPVSALRIRALLALRSGNPQSAKKLFRESADWAGAIGFGTEHAIARLQFGELCAHAELRVAERLWKQEQREGTAALRERGYDPVPQAYVVAHSLTLSSRNRMAERLTRREVQVLGLLSEGLSYRAVSEQLHITEPTVQTLAHRAYQKLGVSGRAAAAKEAKRLGVL
jgi:ATP/maltotriose-dependent transcriptional regulator MalT